MNTVCVLMTSIHHGRLYTCFRRCVGVASPPPPTRCSRFQWLYSAVGRCPAREPRVLPHPTDIDLVGNRCQGTLLPGRVVRGRAPPGWSRGGVAGSGGSLNWRKRWCGWWTLEVERLQDIRALSEGYSNPLLWIDDATPLHIFSQTAGVQPGTWEGEGE